MRGKKTMRGENLRSALRMALVLLLFYLLQVILLARFRPWGVVPLSLPLLAVAAGLFSGGVWGGCIGLFAGILCDSSLGDSVLLFTVLLTVLGFFSGFLGEFVMARGFPSFVLLSLICLILCTGLQAVLFAMLIPTPWKILLQTALRQLLITLPFLIPAYLAVRWAMQPIRAARKKSTF